MKRGGVRPGAGCPSFGSSGAKVHIYLGRGDSDRELRVPHALFACSTYASTNMYILLYIILRVSRKLHICGVAASGAKNSKQSRLI